MKDDELVRLLDNYMGKEGFYMKPFIEDDGTSSFFMAKDKAKSSDVAESFESVKDAIGVRQEKELQLFTPTFKVECPVCADVPNMCEVLPDNVRKPTN